MKNLFRTFFSLVLGLLLSPVIYAGETNCPVPDDVFAKARQALAVENFSVAEPLYKDFLACMQIKLAETEALKKKGLTHDELLLAANARRIQPAGEWEAMTRLKVAEDLEEIKGKIRANLGDFAIALASIALKRGDFKTGEKYLDIALVQEDFITKEQKRVIREAKEALIAKRQKSSAQR